MPLAFPSHQGLILPITRVMRLDVVALCVGAALPDIVEVFFWPIRPELGQWIGHSLLGVVLFAPVGLLSSVLARRLRSRYIERLGPELGTKNALVAVMIGDLSHVVSDFVTHANCVLFVPFYEPATTSIFPTWWTHTWTSVRVPLVYKAPYPIAPHTIVWALMSILGSVLFVRFVFRRSGR